MFSLLKMIIWIVGVLVVALFVLNFFGYTVNHNYFNYSKEQCQAKVKECTDKVVHQGIDNAGCDFQCVNPKLIIKKK